MSVNQGFMRIGEVHAQLRKLFPEVELSKIRYYEDKGLVQPSRSRKGYRLYSERDVECLREAIRLAQEEFVPLRVVRLRLIEQGLLTSPNVTSATRQIARETPASAVSVPAPPANARPALSVVSDGDAQTAAPVKDFFTTSELLATTGLEPDDFNQMQSTGLITPVVVDGETMYSALDVRVAAHARALLSRGVEARLLGSLRRVAEREVGVVDDLTAPLRQGGHELSRDEVLAITTDVAREVAALRSVLVERELLVYLRD
jgi:DNA-binding transcriptional MerR regulator/predicted nucleic acid-binding protein